MCISSACVLESDTKKSYAHVCTCTCIISLFLVLCVCVCVCRTRSIATNTLGVTPTKPGTLYTCTCIYTHVHVYMYSYSTAVHVLSICDTSLLPRNVCVAFSGGREHACSQAGQCVGQASEERGAETTPSHEGWYATLYKKVNVCTCMYIVYIHVHVHMYNIIHVNDHNYAPV